MTTRLTLVPVNANVLAVQTLDGQHLGNLKRIGDIWKFKAIGYTAQGALEPGGGPLTAQHNVEFATPDEAAVNTCLACHL